MNVTLNELNRVGVSKILDSLRFKTDPNVSHGSSFSFHDRATTKVSFNISSMVGLDFISQKPILESDEKLYGIGATRQKKFTKICNS